MPGRRPSHQPKVAGLEARTIRQIRRNVAPATHVAVSTNACWQRLPDHARHLIQFYGAQLLSHVLQLRMCDRR